MECVQGRRVRDGMCAGEECEGWYVCRGGVRGVVCVQGRSVRGGMCAGEECEGWDVCRGGV